MQWGKAQRRRMLSAPFSANSGDSASVTSQRRRRTQTIALVGVAALVVLYVVAYVDIRGSSWAGGGAGGEGKLCLHRRSTVLGASKASTTTEVVKGSDVAVIVMDMWNHHCCEAAEDRAALLAPHINNTVSTLRESGALIVHIPHNVIDFYAGTGARKRAQQYSGAKLPRPVRPMEERRSIVERTEPPVTVDNDPRMTCLCDAVPDPSRRYTRQTDIISIDDTRDAITSDPRELYGLFQAQGIKTVLYVGVHLNICVLWYRQTSLIPVQELGFETLIVRDLTDVLSEVQHPEQLHSEKNAAMLRHIEKH